MYNINFAGINFNKNGVLASGIMGVTGWSMAHVAKLGAGGITCKSISHLPRKGHPTPVVQVYSSGVLNAVGLSSTGVENSLQELSILKSNSDTIVIASVFGSTKEDFFDTIKLLDNPDIDMFEANISCPNVKDEFGLPFSYKSESAYEVINHIRSATKKPLIAKLSPNVHNIGEIAKSCEDGGADGITAINTVGPGMLFDINTYYPKLSNKTGGISGPAILPIAVRCVYDIFKSVKIPIIGVGGITCTEDALQLIIAGATLYSVGTGIMYENVDIFNKINNGIDQYLTDKKISYNDLIGIAHKI